MKMRQCCISLLMAFSLLAPIATQAMPFLPEFNAATFSPGAPINNPFFPVVTGVSRTYQGQREEGGEIITEGFELSNVGLGPTILGVQPTIQRDRAFEDSVILEDTFDYYAQDTVGNVWCLGEDITNFIFRAPVSLDHHDESFHLVLRTRKHQHFRDCV